MDLANEEFLLLKAGWSWGFVQTASDFLQRLGLKCGDGV